jgi:aspartyl-tRNA(Asn)/glutamyl-tRNA(Gln) amidotransferase subunit A
MSRTDSAGAYLNQYEAAGSNGALKDGSLKDVPVAIKDLIVIDDDQPTTAASKMLEPFVSPYTSTVVQKLLDAGAVVSGKTNLDEFAMGSSTETSALGKTTNPWDAERVPGGSSGGSAAAVAARDVPLALGTDTGGSIRQPAALCGVVGFKPTYGRVSRYGLMAMASSLDQAGTFSLTVEDTATLLNAISGADPHDATSVDKTVPDYRKALTGDVKGLKVGLPKEYFIDGVQPEVEQAVRGAAEDLKKQGAEITEISLPHTKYSIGVYYIVMPAEASSNLARYDGIRYGASAETDPDSDAKTLLDIYLQTKSKGFGDEVKRRIMLGTYVLSSGYYDAYYKRAMAVRTLVKQDFEEAFKQVDVILTPTTPTTAFKMGAKTDDPLQMYLNDIFTVPANLAGIPAISVPAGFDEQGLPIGLQLMGPQWGEEVVLRTAHAYEQQHEWSAKAPKEAA